MPSTKLPPELVSLVHHIELNKAGWWDRGSQWLILATIWLSEHPLTQSEIKARVLQDLHLDVDEETLKKHIDRLRGANSLVTLSDGRLKIPESARTKFEQTIKEAEDLETRAKARFIVHLQEFCSEVDCEKAWKLFGENFLWPLMREVGARTYQLITGSASDWDATVGFQSFLVLFPDESRQRLASAVLAFLDPKDAVTRSYVLRHLNAYFFIEAGKLEKPTIEALAKLTTRPPSFAIFVDTNFLFSILGLHENPSNEAANLLMGIVTELKGRVVLRLYASPLTIDEARRSVVFHRDMLRGLDLPSNLAEAATADDLGGVARKYFETSRHATHPIGAEDYFAPYLKDLVSILKAKGVELYNESMDALKVKQEVIDDILAEQESEKRKFEGTSKVPKSYEKLEHDITLWHFAKKKRPAAVESPLDAHYWIVTLDHRLIAFDTKRTRAVHGSTPVCLHPTSLIQMLQFWLPRTPEFEEAMLGSLRWPFLTQDFDPETEKVTIRILQSLNRFENAGDLPAEVVQSLLVKEALRQKVSVEPDPQKREELVREALIEENKRITEEREKVRSKLGETEDERDRLKAELAEKEQHLSISQQQKQEAEESRRDLQERLEEVERNLNAQKEEAARRREIRRFAIKSTVVFVIAFGAGLAGARGLRNDLPLWKLVLLFETLAAVVWAWLTDWLATRTPAVKGGKFQRIVGNGKKAGLAILGAVVLAVTSDTIRAWAETLFQKLHH